MAMKCKLIDCKNNSSSKVGFCPKHYACWKRTGDAVPRIKPHGNTACKVSGCEDPYRRGGFCQKHYTRFSRHGDTEVHFATKYSSDAERISAIKASKKKYRNTVKGKLAGILKRQRRRSNKFDDVVLTPGQVTFLFDQFDNKCFNCESTEDLTLDHHLPLVLRGKLEIGNVVVLCRSCNGQKSKTPPQDWYSKEKFETVTKKLEGILRVYDNFPRLYLLCGTHGVGKTTLIKELGNQFSTVEYDKFKRDTIREALHRSQGQKPVVIETPMNVSSWMNDLSSRFRITLVVLDEPEEILAERISLRGGELTTNVLRRKEAMLRYHRRYGGFKGNYQEVLEFLRKYAATQ